MTIGTFAVSGAVPAWRIAVGAVGAGREDAAPVAVLADARSVTVVAVTPRRTAVAEAIARLAPLLSAGTASTAIVVVISSSATSTATSAVTGGLPEEAVSAAFGAFAVGVPALFTVAVSAAYFAHGVPVADSADGRSSAGGAHSRSGTVMAVLDPGSAANLAFPVSAARGAGFPALKGPGDAAGAFAGGTHASLVTGITGHPARSAARMALCRPRTVPAQEAARAGKTELACPIAQGTAFSRSVATVAFSVAFAQDAGHFDISLMLVVLMMPAGDGRKAGDSQQQQGCKGSF